MNRIISVALAFGLGRHFYKTRLTEQEKNDFKGFIQSLGNSYRASIAMSLCVYDYTFNLPKYDESSKEEYYKIRSQIHSKVANRILKLSETNRGIYLKAGQYIGNLERVMPKEYTDVLKVLQDSGPSLPFEQIKCVVEEDLGKEINEIFDSFEPQAIAAASLAQVHRAKLKTGDEVAVKLQFPSLRIQTKFDLRVIERITSLSNYLLTFYNYKDIDLLKLFRTFKSALIEELDFEKEVKNGEKTRAFFQENKNVYIPQFHIDKCSSRLITMEFVYGCKINNKEQIEAIGLEPLDCASILIDTFAKMIFLYGHVHCDAHPGNILIRKHPENEPQLILLDHGMYRELDDEFRLRFCRLWRALVGFNYNKLKLISYELGIGEYYRYLPLIFLFRTIGSKKALGAKITEEEKKEIRDKELISFQNINYLLQALPPDVMFILRASNLVAIHNTLLGGLTRTRLKRFTELALRNLYPNPIIYLIQKYWILFKVFLFERYHDLFVKLFKSYSVIY